VAATVVREHQETDAPVSLPSPPKGHVRLWMKNSWFNPRVLEVNIQEEFTAVVEWPRDYVDVAEDDVLLAGAKPEALDDPRAVLRLVVAHKLARRPRMVHRTFALEHGVLGKAFEVYEEYDRPKKALERFRALALPMWRYDPLKVDEDWWIPIRPSDPKERSLLMANGLLGLMRTEEGRAVYRKIKDAIGKGLLKAPIPYGEYTKEVDDPLTEGEAGALVNLGVLCSRCPGMTWGEVGYEVMRGMKGA
jgi:hypothetical protein